jgi:hypothetical protein
MQNMQLFIDGLLESIVTTLGAEPIIYYVYITLLLFLVKIVIMIITLGKGGK